MRNSQALRCNLLDLGMESLSHLRAAVVHLHAAVLIYEDQRPSLVEGCGRKRDAELDGGNSYAPLAMRMSGVKPFNIFASREKIRVFL